MMTWLHQQTKAEVISANAVIKQYLIFIENITVVNNNYFQFWNRIWNLLSQEIWKGKHKVFNTGTINHYNYNKVI